MLRESDRRLLVALALLCALPGLVRLVRALPTDEVDTPSPRAALAENMEVFELSLRWGSPYSVNAFTAVEDGCRALADDPEVARACRLFDDAVHHAADRGAIDRAARLLRGS